ncbi:MAG: hypothetical protein ACR2FI_00185 [Burkholderiales bacterium]|nr:hypothetical protein [Burkholderiales bacterium]MDQ3196420.1 hypothetical protein [Pseudomonadota bacterium]
MFEIKRSVPILSGLILFTAASASIAGRYGDDEIRHWDQINKARQTVEQTAASERGRSIAGPAGEEMIIEGKPGKQLHKRSPFQKNGAG